MNYRKVYLKIIQNAKKQNRRKGEIYYENHHILPKCLFPLWKNRKSNLVLLTAREHFFCHQLLTKIYPGDKMFLALWHLTIKTNNSKEYERLKIKFSEFLKSAEFNKRKGKDNPCSKKVINLNTGEIFESVRQAKNPHIVESCKFKHRTANGCFWEYYEEGLDIKQELQNRLIFKELHYYQIKKVKNISTGIIYNSLKEANKDTGISHSKISLACQGKRKTAGGFRWEYVS